jgi:outer membrane immunogenic protein
VRRSAPTIAPLALAIALAAPGVKADELYRTNTGPNGADFSGVELGPDLGVGFGSASSANISGPAGGAHVGYNIQSNRIVGGVEADAMFSGIRSGSYGPASFSQDFLSSARVKAGYSFGDLMAYGTLGWAWSTTNYQDLGVSSNETVKGLALGVGAEFALTRNFSLRAEVLHYDFGNAGYATPYSSQEIYTSTNVARLGGSVHF